MRTMLKAAIFSYAIMLSTTGVSWAQQPGGMHGGMMTGSGSTENMMMMSGMMQHMQHMMAGGRMGPEHQKKMSEIMGKMSNIMNEMHGPNAMKLQTQHHKQLEDLDKQLKSIPE